MLYGIKYSAVWGNYNYSNFNLVLPQLGSMEQGNSRRRALRYEGEDVSPTTSRELKGFYAYGLAAEVFAVCGVGTLP